MMNPSPKYSGEPSAQALASGLATLGRYGDNYMVHAAEGETMIPKEVFDENPGLKQDLFRQMTMMGIEDPNRYVVGNALNSINPITGQPEFFFKKIFRAVKKVFKKIVPIAAPIIGNIIAPGIGGIIASGLVTKMQGGSWGDALKSAALSYGASALTSGVGGLVSGTQAGDALGIARGDTFMGGLSRGLSAPFSAASNLFSSGAQNPLAQGILGPRGTGTIFSSLGGTKANPSAFAQSGQKGIMGTIMPSYQTDVQLQGLGIDPATGGQYLNPGSQGELGLRSLEPATIKQRTTITDPNSGMQQDIIREVPNPNAGTIQVQDPATGQIKRIQVQSSAAAGQRQPTAGEFLRANAGDASVPANVTQTAASSDPGFLQRNLGATGGRIAEKAIAGAIVPAVLAAATYALTPEEQSVEEYLKANPQDPNRAAYDQWQSIEDKSSPEAIALKNKWYGESQYSASQLASSFGANPLRGITSSGVASLPAAPNISSGPLGPGLGLNLAAAGGGEIVGPGTGTSDSIPARLSDGEFVMTAKAVRNAGNGDRDVGAARMYDMMNRFERGVA